MDGILEAANGILHVGLSAFFFLSMFRENTGKAHEVSADWIKCLKVRALRRSGCLAYQKIKVWFIQAYK